MARVSITVCDRHSATDQIPARSYRIAIDDEVTTPDLCESCVAPILALFEELRTISAEPPAVSEAPAPIAAPIAAEPSSNGHNPSIQDYWEIRNGQKVFVCPVEGCPKTTPTAQGLRVHGSRAHNITRLIPLDYSCTEPGCPESFNGEDNLRAHLMSWHGKVPV